MEGPTSDGERRRASAGERAPLRSSGESPQLAVHGIDTLRETLAAREREAQGLIWPSHAERRAEGPARPPTRLMF